MSLKFEEDLVSDYMKMAGLILFLSWDPKVQFIILSLKRIF